MRLLTSIMAGDSTTLYKNVHEQIFTLPDSTKVR